MNKDKLNWVNANKGKIQFGLNYDTLCNRKHRTVGTVKGAVKVLKEFQTIPKQNARLKNDNNAQNLFDRAVSIFLSQK